MSIKFDRMIGLIVAATALSISPAIAESRTQAQCQKDWLQAEKAGIFHGEQFVAGVPTVVVDEQVWRNANYQTKRGMALTFTCAIAAPGRMLREIVFVSNMTNRVLGRWTPGKGLEVSK